MKWFASGLFALGFGLGLVHGQDQPPIVVYYYTQWAVWVRQFCANQLGAADHFRGITHVQYAFHAPDESCHLVTKDYEADFGGAGWDMPCEKACGVAPGWPDNSEQGKHRGSVGCLHKMAQEQGFKVGLSLGGWTLSKDFSQCVQSDSKRAVFIGEIVKSVTDYGWDFVDFDWEYPYGGGLDGFVGQPNDWEKFKLLITELKAALAASGKSNVGLAAALGMNPDLLRGVEDYSMATPFAWMCENLEYLSTMSYDLAGGWQTTTGWPAPLHSDPAAPYKYADMLSIEWHLNYIKGECGSNFNKVILGLPMYAKSWQAVPPGPDGTGLYQDCDSATAKPNTYFPDMPCLADSTFKDTVGTLELWDIEMNYKTDDRCAVYYHELAAQEFLYCRGPMFQDNGAFDVWFSYDAAETYYYKGKFAAELGAGGVMYWEPAYVELGDAGSPPGPQTGSMESKKAQVYNKNIGSLTDKYFFKNFEDALSDGWWGRPIQDYYKSKGKRVGCVGSCDGEGGEGGEDVKCDEVTSASVSDGSIDSSCVSSFCTHVCTTFKNGDCADATDKRSCIQQAIHNIPPAGKSGYHCSFA